MVVVMMGMYIAGVYPQVLFSCFLVSFPLLKISPFPLQFSCCISSPCSSWYDYYSPFYFFLFICYFHSGGLLVFSWGVFQKSEMAEILFKSQCLYLLAKMAMQKITPVFRKESDFCSIFCLMTAQFILCMSMYRVHGTFFP